jgi:hypothetical protein
MLIFVVFEVSRGSNSKFLHSFLMMESYELTIRVSFPNSSSSMLHDFINTERNYHCRVCVTFIMVARESRKPLHTAFSHLFLCGRYLVGRLSCQTLSPANCKILGFNRYDQETIWSTNSSTVLFVGWNQKLYIVPRKPQDDGANWLVSDSRILNKETWWS